MNERRLFVKGCSACGKSHDIDFTTTPVDEGEYAGVCVNTGRLVFMREVDDAEAARIREDLGTWPGPGRR